MTKEDCYHNLEWDYSGWRDTELGSSLYNQVSWNNTLITKINQLSAMIFKESLRGGANRIKITKKFLPVLESYEFYYNGTIGGRYQVEIEDTFKFGKNNYHDSEDVIYVYRKEENNLIFVPRLTKFSNGMDEISFQLPNDEYELNLQKRKYNGSITILNYNKDL